MFVLLFNFIMELVWVRVVVSVVLLLLLLFLVAVVWHIFALEDSGTKAHLAAYSTLGKDTANLAAPVPAGFLESAVNGVSQTNFAFVNGWKVGNTTYKLTHTMLMKKT